MSAGNISRKTGFNHCGTMHLKEDEGFARLKDKLFEEMKAEKKTNGWLVVKEGVSIIQFGL